MIALAVVGYGAVANALLTALQTIAGPQDHILAVNIAADGDIERQRQAILEGIKRLDHGDGVLVLTDKIGETGANLVLSILQDCHAQMVTGVNLGMLVEVAKARRRSGHTLAALGEIARDSGRAAINLVSVGA